MASKKITKQIYTILECADEETLQGYAQSWLEHVAKQSPKLLQEEFDKYMEPQD